MEEGAVLEDRPSGLIIEENSFPSWVIKQMIQ